MKLHVPTAGAAVVAAAVLGALALAPAAHATDITNPAQHPAPITLVIDGQTYYDGQDTLPGFDDYACTAIPGVQYDYADDQIVYPDGQVAHWTEWQRIPGYQTWQKQQAASSTPSKGGGSTGSSTPPKSGSTTPKGDASSSGQAAGSGTSTAPDSSPSDAASTAASPRKHAGDKSTADDQSGDQSSASASADTVATDDTGDAGDAGSSAAVPVDDATTADTELSSAVTSTIGQGAGNTSLAGAAILGGLAVVCLGALLGGALRRQVARRRS